MTPFQQAILFMIIINARDASWLLWMGIVRDIAMLLHFFIINDTHFVRRPMQPCNCKI